MLRKSVVLFTAAALAWVLGKWAAGALMSGKPREAPEGAPRLTAYCRQRDLGTVPQGQTLRVAFPVSNHGTRRLILTEHVKGCCGEAPTPRRYVVPPGQSLDVLVEVDTSPWFGPMRHEAEYETNDQQTPRLVLTIMGLVTTATDGPSTSANQPQPAQHED